MQTKDKLSTNSVIDWRDRFSEAYQTQRVNDDPNKDLITDIPLWRNRSRWQSYNSPLSKAPIQNFSTLAVGLGFMVNPRPNIKLDNLIEIKRNIARLYNTWGNYCGIDGQSDAQSILKQILVNMLRDGDVLVSITEDNSEFKLNIIDATRIQTPPAEYLKGKLCYSGVVVTGKVIKGYWVKNEQAKNPWKFYPCKDPNGRFLNILLKNPLTSDITGSYRGLPILGPVLDTIDDLRRLLKNELRASDAKTTQIGVMESDRSATAGEDISDEILNSMGYKKMDGIELFVVSRGDKLTWTNGSEISNPEISNLYKLYLKQIASVFGVAYPALYADFDDNTYSTNQSILAEAYKATKGVQRYLINNLWKPLYDLNLEKWIAEKKIPGLSNWTPEISDCAFQGLPISVIRQKDLTDSTIKKIEAGIISQQMAILDEGNNPWEVLDDIEEWETMTQKAKIPTNSDIDLKKNEQIIDIFSKVYNNEMSKESAEFCLKTFYNFSDEQLSQLRQTTPKVNIEALTNVPQRAGL